MFLPSFACCVFACFFSWTVADISSMKYETDLATHGMPLAECKWDVKDKQIIALTLTDNNASEIVTIKHDISQCMVDVGSKAFVRCDQDEKVLSVSVLFPDFEFGETRTYICNATLFGDGVWEFMTFRTNATKKLQRKGDEPRDDDECSCLGHILTAVGLAAVVLGLLPLNIYSLFKCFQAKFRSPHEDSKMDSTQEIDRQNDPVKLDQSGTVESKPTTDAELGEPPEELSDSDEEEQGPEEVAKILLKDEGGSKAAKGTAKGGADSGFSSVNSSRSAFPFNRPKKPKGGRRKDTPCAHTERPYDCMSASQAPDSPSPPAGPQASKANGYTVLKTDEPVDCTGQEQAKQRRMTTKPRQTTGPSEGTAGRGRGGYSDPA